MTEREQPDLGHCFNCGEPGEYMGLEGDGQAHFACCNCKDCLYCVIKLTRHPDRPELVRVESLEGRG